MHRNNKPKCKLIECFIAQTYFVNTSFKMSMGSICHYPHNKQHSVRCYKWNVVLRHSFSADVWRKRWFNVYICQDSFVITSISKKAYIVMCSMLRCFCLGTGSYLSIVQNTGFFPCLSSVFTGIVEY